MPQSKFMVVGSADYLFATKSDVGHLSAIRIAVAAARHPMPHGFMGAVSARRLDLRNLALCLYG